MMIGEKHFRQLKCFYGEYRDSYILIIESPNNGYYGRISIPKDNIVVECEKDTHINTLYSLIYVLKNKELFKEEG